jgi:anti-sigma-K factor RskA
MAQRDKDQSYARKFLLGYLPEGERQIIEERLISDPDYLQLLLQVENDLMEDYIAGQLSEDKRKRFDNYVLTNQRQVEQLNLTRALGEFAAVDAAAHSPPMVKGTTDPLMEGSRTDFLRAKFWGINVVLAAVILFTIGGLAVMIVLRSRSSENNNQQGSLGQELAKLNAQQNLDPEAILHGFIIGPLKPGLSRDDETNRSFVISATERIVQLRLQIGNGQYQAFQVALQTDEGQDIVTLSDLKEKIISGEKLLVIYLPARILIPGDYQVRLSGANRNNQIDYLGRYTFRVIGK